MYAVVEYFNYRKDVSFEILKLFRSLWNAEAFALECAEKDSDNGKAVEDVSEKYVDLGNEILIEFTNGNGYCKNVFAVVQISEPED